MDKNDTKSKNKDSIKQNEDNGDRKAEKENSELLKRRIEELENQNKRLLADYRNLEKRVETERRDWILKANKQLILHLLPVLYTLIFAAKTSKDEGIKLAVKQFEDILTQEGLEKIETKGKQFDPRLMRAIDTKNGREGEVLEEVYPGYIHRVDKSLLKEADVIVGKEKIENEVEEKAKKELQKGDYM